MGLLCKFREEDDKPGIRGTVFTLKFEQDWWRTYPITIPENYLPETTLPFAAGEGAESEQELNT